MKITDVQLFVTGLFSYFMQYYISLCILYVAKPGLREESKLLEELSFAFVVS